MLRWNNLRDPQSTFRGNFDRNGSKKQQSSRLREFPGMMPSLVPPECQHVAGFCQGEIGNRPEDSPNMAIILHDRSYSGLVEMEHSSLRKVSPSTK